MHGFLRNKIQHRFPPRTKVLGFVPKIVMQKNMEGKQRQTHKRIPTANAHQVN